MKMRCDSSHATKGCEVAKEVSERFEEGANSRRRGKTSPCRVSAELRATGQIKPRAADNVPNLLTPQEFEIVSLAASV
jgi:hypothetical protein